MIDKLKNIVSFLALMLIGTAALAVTPTAGKVYKFENVGAPGYFLDVNGGGEDVVVKKASSSHSQDWYCESTGVLRSLQTGHYLCSPAELYVHWTTTLSSTTSNKMTFTESSGLLTMRRSNLSGDRYLHADASHNCVCWNNTADASKWRCTEVSISSSEISSLLAQASTVNNAANNQSAYQSALSQLFSDNACTVLKVSNPTSTSAYSQLPDVLKTMVTKVQSGNWAESDGNWDSTHAKRFRVQSFKPYSRGREIADMLGGIFFHTNMNNPSGIVTVNSDVLYVMVDSEPASGSTLYIKPVGDEGLYNDYASGTQLHAGLNVIPAHSECLTYYIYYTVDTYNTTSKTKNRRLSDFSPIKIHFEGGKLNGFWELGTDSNADWEYYRTRARHLMFDFNGKYVNLHFHFDQTQTGSDYSETVPGVKSILQNIDVNQVLTKWDEMAMVERLTFGVLSPAEVYSPTAQGLFESLSDVNYHDYFNNRIQACTGTGAIYMNSGHWRTQYNTNTMGAMLTGMLWGGDGMWGPAHEFGHAVQEPMNFAGVSEMSNNIFSNVAVYYGGKYTSRAELPSVHRQQFLQGTKFLDRGAFDETRMWWQLFLYYHVAGHNKRFYPRLQELLRQSPLQHPVSPSTVNERYDMLHFAKKCCEAAGEDLTEFFTTWGFFVPFSETRTDYSTFNLSLIQSDINAVKAEIAAMNLPKNTAIIFIDDRPGSARASYPEFNKLMCGQFGGIDAFKSGKTSNASYSIVDGKIIISGNPGAGIALYDSAGNLVDFTNEREFTVSTQLLAQIQSGSVKVKAVDCNNTITQLQQTPDPTPLYDNIRRLLMLVDEEGTTVGKYQGSATYALKKAFENKGDISYADLLKEYEAVVANADARIQIQPDKPYHLVNRAYPNLSLALDATNTGLKGIATNMEDASQTWIPVETSAGRYALRNSYESKYVGSCARSTQVSLTSGLYSYEIKIADEDNDGVYWALCYDGDETKALHVADTRNYLTVGWDASAEPSQWIIQYVGDVMDDTGMAELREWVEKTRQLVGQVATIESSFDNITLSESMLSSNALMSGYVFGDNFTSWDVLLDGDESTYLQSRRDGNDSDDGLDHYLQVDLGQDNMMQSFGFYFSTKNASNSYSPKTMVIYSSVDGENWSEITTITDLPKVYPTTYESELLYAAEPSRYFRFMITATSGDVVRGGHKPFCISEFGLRTTNNSVLIDYDTYSFVTEDMVTDANDLVNTGNTLLNSKSNAVQRLECIDSLKDAYQRLYDAMQRGSMSAIDRIGADQTDADALDIMYDLYGRRVVNPTHPGLYISKGKKIIIK